MVNIPMKSSAPLTKQTIISINDQKNLGALTSNTISSINNGYSAPSESTSRTSQSTLNPNYSASSSQPATQPIVSTMTIPTLYNKIQKGQKFSLENCNKLTQISVKLGWNVLNQACDVDVSAFLLNNSGKVIGDDWFVFYGQETSPDGSTVFRADSGQDRECISINLDKLNSCVSKIVFVLTINEALEKNLNFSMLNDAYIRIIDTTHNSEIVSFQMTDYYPNVTSMMIGELYLYNGNWKFNAIGNGVAKDLAGLCELYGVQVI